MIDYFALLGQPQRPWLDEEELKRVYHDRTLHSHPDANAQQTGADFAELNEAYRTLRDPRLRLKHLIALNGGHEERDHSIPQSIQELFPTVDSAMSSTTGVLEKFRAGSNAIIRALRHDEMIRTRAEVERLLKTLSEMRQAATEQLRALDAAWSSEKTMDAVRLEQIFSYIGHWTAQLEELKFQLDTFI